MYVQSLFTFLVVRMVVIRQYVRHGSLVLGVICRKLCNGNSTIVGVFMKMSAFYMHVEGVSPYYDWGVFMSTYCPYVFLRLYVWLLFVCMSVLKAWFQV